MGHPNLMRQLEGAMWTGNFARKEKKFAAGNRTSHGDLSHKFIGCRSALHDTKSLQVNLFWLLTCLDRT
jgi:hypothetical protein